MPVPEDVPRDLDAHGERVGLTGRVCGLVLRAPGVQADHDTVRVQLPPDVRTARGRRIDLGQSQVTAVRSQRHLRREVLEAEADGGGEEPERQRTADSDGCTGADGDTDEPADDVVRRLPYALAFDSQQLCQGFSTDVTLCK